MRRYPLTISTLLGLCFLALIACAQTSPTVSQAQVPPAKPGTARVWFLRGTISTLPDVLAFAPMIYANGAPVAPIPDGSEFFRDFAPGNYEFTVQPYASPMAKATTVQLAAGTETYLNVDWVLVWTQGDAANVTTPWTFAILAMAPQVAQAYLPTLGYLGER